MGYIFISYSHKDKKYVHRLQATLQKEGFEVWIDDRIDYGDEWPTVIQAKLDGCDAFIVVMSTNSSKSDMVQNEMARAREKKKPIFPVLLEGDNWLIVQAKQFADVRHGSTPTKKFYKRLEAVTQRKTKIPEGEVDEGSILVKMLSDVFVALKSTLVKAGPVWGSVGIIGIIIILCSLVSWLGPRFASLLPTASPTATVTFTPTNTEHPTAVKILAPTSTKTKAPIATATVTSTDTPTRTPTDTSTPTFTHTPTFTATPLPTIHADIKSRRSDYPLGVPLTFLSERSTITDANGRKSYCNQTRTCTYEWSLRSATDSLVDLDQSGIYIFIFDTPGPYSLTLKVCYLDTVSCDTANLSFDVKQ